MTTAVLAGLVMRGIQFLSNRSLYIDEAAIALNLRTRTFAELLARPLDFAQTAAPGFLAQQKLMIMALGEHESVLRFVPMLAAIASVPLFAVIARRILTRPAATVASWLFAFSLPLIYFAADSKPYTVDLLITLLLLLIGLRLFDRLVDWKEAAVAAVIGGAAVWFSQPAIFVLGGVALALLARIREQESRAPRWPMLAVFGIWSLSALSSLWLAFKTFTTEGRAYMHDFWSSGFLPLPPASLEDWLWLPATVLRISADPVGAVLFPGVTAFVLLVGCLELRRLLVPHILIVAAPVLLTLLASALGEYPFAGINGPFAGRVVLFLAPCFLLITGAGVQAVMRLMRPRYVVPIVVVLVAANVWPTVAMLPIERDEMRPVLEYVARNKQAGDQIYVYYGARHVYEWYEDKVGLADARPILGVCARDDPARYLADVGRIRTPSRVWVILNHVVGGEEPLLRHYFDRNGRRLDRFRAHGSLAMLYDVQNSVDLALPRSHHLLSAHESLQLLACRGLHDWSDASSASTGPRVSFTGPGGAARRFVQ